MLRENTIVLEHQLEDRPLAKKQTELLMAAEQSASGGQNQEQVQSEQNVKSTSEGTREDKHNPERKALLKNDDLELERVSKVC
jgi:RNA polymerase II subunit A-like phosphatase